MITALLSLFALASAMIEEPMYIVTFDRSMATSALHAHIETTLGHLDNAQHIYSSVLTGYSARLSPERLAQIQQHPLFKAVELDQPVFAAKVPKIEDAPTCTKEASASWGLTRVGQRTAAPAAAEHQFPSSAGQGVDVYIIDTGVYVEHSDFEGRAVFGFKADKNWSDRDGNGHGTHVASTVGGRHYGVAPKVDKIIAVKVLSDSGSGSTAGVIAGVDFAASEAKKTGRPSVANLSLGGGYSPAMNNAVDAAMKNLVVVVAGGNDNWDACDYSPASAPTVITVGATSEPTGAGAPDARSYFSNYGDCINIFAPGSSITAAWIGNPTAKNTISGTSMASPHVCGLSALFLAENPDIIKQSNWPQLVKSAIVGAATPGTVELNCPSSPAGNNCKESPVLMAWNECTGAF